MEIERCWMHYLKAEQLMEQGHWPEAQRLYGDVLNSLPHHIQDAAYQSDIQALPICLSTCGTPEIQAWLNLRFSTVLQGNTSKPLIHWISLMR